MFGEPNESHYGILRLPVNGGTADMFAKWPILAEKASLRRVNAAWLSRSERRAYAYSTLRPPTFSGDSLASAVWLTVYPNGADHQWKEDPSPMSRWPHGSAGEPVLTIVVTSVGEPDQQSETLLDGDEPLYPLAP